MEKGSLGKLRKRASLALRSRDFEEAVDAYSGLEHAEPASFIWPGRRAGALQQMGRDQDALQAFGRAAEIAIDQGEVIQAIAFCKQILEIDPDHSETQDRLHLLYMQPTSNSPSTPAPAPAAKAPARRRRRVAASQSPPLEEVLLTQVVPGAGPAGLDDPSDMGIAEIPLTDPRPSRSTREPDVAGSGPRARAGSRNKGRSRDRAERELGQPLPELGLTPLFESLDRASLGNLIERIELVQLGEGETLFRQGDRSDSLYVVAEGAVVPIAEEDSRKKLAVLEAGAFFGEIGLVTNQPRNATIQALVDTRLLAIDRATIWELIDEQPGVLQVMLRFLRDRLVDRLVRTNAFFGAFPTRGRASVARQFRFLEAKDGKVLVDQGRPASHLFALLSGHAQVIQMGGAGDKILANLGPGSLFGEMSLLRQEPAVAAVVTSGKCWVLALSHQRLLQLIADNPGASDIIEDLSQSRRSMNEEQLRAPAWGVYDDDDDDDFMGSL
jgi:CRP-like cAMP-binding protein